VLTDPGAAEIALLCAAVLIGATGTWSPCGFSMIETIGPAGHTGGRWVTPAACATFVPGALVGGVLTFGGLALVGSLLPGGWFPYASAAAIAALAAVAEARGARIAPQIRRQLPEHWRRVMPMPVAAALYGVLLGLGFTTFVLTFGAWALAGISFALGEPGLGLAIGLGFGVGRALPIVALAPIADRPLGRSAVALMADRPGLYRGIRLGDAAALTVVAALLLATGAHADVKRIKPGADPSVERGFIVSQRANGAGQLRNAGGHVTGLPGTDPAIGGGNIAVLQGSDVVVLGREGLGERDRVTVAGADAVAVSGQWLAIRRRVERRDFLEVRPLDGGGRIGAPREVAAAGPPSQLSLPSIGGERLAYAVAKPSRSKLVVFRLDTGKRRTVINTPRHLVYNPSLHGEKVLYVRSKRHRDELRVRNLDGGGDRALRSGHARLWSTALSGRRAYVTVLAGPKPHARIVSVKR
jgi:hypothetical protein